MEILYRGVETKPSKKMASKQKQAAAVTWTMKLWIWMI